MEEFKKWQLFDLASIAYLGLLSLVILFFHRGLNNWGAYIVGHLLIILSIWALVWSVRKKPSRVLVFVRDWYPVLLVVFGFEEMNNLVTIIFPYWANSLVVGLDMAIFGVHPTIWFERLASLWLSEVMVFFLLAYFFVGAVGAGVLYAQKRKEEFYALGFNVVLAYFLCYFLFLFFPAEGPWVIMKDLQTRKLVGGMLTRFYYSLEISGSIKGGCFPSSHVAGAFVVALSMFKYNRKLSSVLLLVAAGVAVAVVYARYHHAVDSIAGILIAVLAVFLGSKINARWKMRSFRQAR